MKKIAAAGVVLFSALALALIAAPSQAANPSLNFYISPPTVQNTYVSGAEVVTFDSYSTGACPTTWTSSTPTTIGTITTNGCQIKTNDQYGGATSGATGSQVSRPSGSGTNYASLSSGKQVTLTLAQPENYLGFWWSAGDATNSIKLYSGGASGTLVGTFTTATLVTMLNSGVGTVTAVDNTSYNSCDYFGNPVRTTTLCGGSIGSNEPFAYVHLFGSNGLTFDTLVFSQGNSGGFEFDNVAIASGVSGPSNTLISFPPDLLAGNQSQTADTCTAFTSNYNWTTANFATDPSFSISPALPAGLSLNAANGVITGSATVAQGQTSYTVTATAGAQSATETVTLGVTDAGNLPCATPSPSPSSSALPSTGARNVSDMTGIAVVLAVSGLVLLGMALRKKH